MNDTANTLLAISVVFLAIAGIAFLVISIVDKSCGAWPLAASLACIVYQISLTLFATDANEKTAPYGSSYGAVYILFYRP